MADENPDDEDALFTEEEDARWAEEDAEADAWWAREEAIARDAGTCCTDPSPAVDDGLVGMSEDTPPGYPGEPVYVYYCQSCDQDMTREQYEALKADLPGVLARIASLRAGL